LGVCYLREKKDSSDDGEHVDVDKGNTEMLNLKANMVEVCEITAQPFFAHEPTKIRSNT
jgi:hypothetical protein